MSRGARLFGCALAAAMLSCGARDPEPAALDPSAETCGFCRMAISNSKFAAQLSAPGEETIFFDDIGCLRDFLGEHAPEPGTVSWVADHRTGSWVRSAAAVYSRCPSLDTPMGSHLIAHESEASRDEDAAVRGCAAVGVQQIFGPVLADGRKDGD